MVLYTHWMSVDLCWMKRFASQASKSLCFPRCAKINFMTFIHLCFLFCMLLHDQIASTHYTSIIQNFSHSELSLQLFELNWTEFNICLECILWGNTQQASQKIYFSSQVCTCISSPMLPEHFLLASISVDTRGNFYGPSGIR